MSSLFGLGLISNFPYCFGRERITITATEFEIRRTLDFQYCISSRTEASEEDSANELEGVMQGCLTQQISGNTSELMRAQVRIHCLRMGGIVAFTGR